MDLAVYWRYEKIDPPSAADSVNVDACIVFTGPAKPITNFRTEYTANEFAKCTSDYTGGEACMISPMVWSPLSLNKVIIFNRPC